MTDRNGLAADLRPSPNFGTRAEGVATDLIILHYTDMPTAEEAIEWLCNPVSQVSAHYVVAEDGRITQLVDEADRAWHAGLSCWETETDINSRSIGIEIANAGHDHGYPDFPAAQIDAVIGLCRDIQSRHPVKPRGILAHSDVAPARKRDPGEKFPWAALAAAGIGHFVPPEPLGGGRAMQPGDEGYAVGAFQALLFLYGYGLDVTGIYDEATVAVVSAFQRHFRPARIDGLADASTVATLHKLARALAPPDLAPAVSPIGRIRRW
ncbi:N-acetylmuramoyl-L-alanine amidase [Kaistia geumhonensis]|uniref:N-acetylmuramoyl-L-alanine amidase n=1 Tax=Kaistia geumhonensis TaxID=410839 RepID=A0ABU0MBW4_9HYPH|nr:N-acetylmuramoyl-L-alanine amidase [Kaistia geumhonensis]MCX5481390.1 N-acetylmuramoyl-L-alanine amidase [Kaistia geumhonensis]MDQ0518455.1 N-acetylmuramoyl-L-alanine amidase [Kaistia geumhonensis]